eukprot:c30456_g1_i1 orf=454-804(-)
MMVGLAAMICLLFLSFGVLLCCYYKLLTTFERRDQSQALHIQQPLHSDEGSKESDTNDKGPTSEEMVVIMAGKSTPTFLALPTLVQESPTKQVIVESSLEKHALTTIPTTTNLLIT